MGNFNALGQLLQLDFIEDLIVNLQIDLSVKAGGFLQTLGLERLFSFETNLLNKSIYMLKQKRISSRYVSDFKFEEMCNFFAMLPLFHYIKVDLKNIDNFTSKKAFQKVVVSFKFLQLEPIELEETLIVGRRNCAFLEELVFNDKKEFGKEQAKEQSITANYLYFESDNMFTINYVNNDELPFDEKSSHLDVEIHHQTLALVAHADAVLYHSLAAQHRTQALTGTLAHHAHHAVAGRHRLTDDVAEIVLRDFNGSVAIIDTNHKKHTFLFRLIETQLLPRGNPVIGIVAGGGNRRQAAVIGGHATPSAQGDIGSVGCKHVQELLQRNLAGQIAQIRRLGRAFLRHPVGSFSS